MFYTKVLKKKKSNMRLYDNVILTKLHVIGEKVFTTIFFLYSLSMNINL